MADKPEVGRPLLYDEKLVFLNASITPQQKAWLRMQPGGISGSVRRLLDAAMEAEQQPETWWQRAERMDKYLKEHAAELEEME